MLALARAAADADGADPFSEHALLSLRRDATAPPGDIGTPVRHLLLRESDGTLAGYANLERSAGTGPAAAEFVVHPSGRRRGLGRSMVGTLVGSAAGGLEVWAHGDHPSAAALGLDLGFERVRELWQMRRSLAGPLPEPEFPDGVVLRAFRPGSDDEAWLAVNRRAFADHPEQGQWTRSDLRVRMSEPWFDPAGFLLAVAERGGELLGFHWTKVHDEPGRADDPEGGRPRRPAPIGEVYVVGVDPAAHGAGLGRALTVAGLRHLRGRGLDRVMLFVDESNAPAVRLYRRLGFARWSTHVRYRRS